ncbi:serine/threonine-protein kinase MARK2-like [Rhinolophus ferrumequinum]|uniref:serine/threonine-protein kinase MARK2-like n=1 Tax=Rhinolophus ferrumequinum TaxID=59479 RepID=UPI00140FFA94|nr:serine/threonine-protein kinase MARK2-like [Rhinolophus ferrumequinum]
MSRDSTDIPVDQEPPTAHYELNGSIGEGSFGNVVVGTHILTPTQVAVKVIKQQVSDKTRSSLLQEARCMADLQHPNIVQLFHGIIAEESLYLVMEFVPGGDMMDYLRDNGRMSEDTARGVFRQLVSAVHYCHEKGVAHRDLKPENVLLDSRMNATLVDFGLGASSNIHQLSKFCGTFMYTAPEVFLGKTYDGCAADIWSLGMLLYKMLTNMVPFDTTSWPVLMMKIRSGQYFVPTYLSTQVANLLQKLLNLHPRQRDNLRDIMSDPWINMGQEEELKPYVEPPSDVIDTWVMEEMVNLGFGEEDIKNALVNKIYNNILATYRILHRKNLKYQHRIIKVKPFHPPEFQSRSPSPAQEVQSELSGCQQAEQLPMDHEPGEKAEESAGPTYTQDYSTAISQSRTTLPPSRPGSKTAIPEPSRKSRNATPEPPPPKHCWGSRTSTPEHSQGSSHSTTSSRGNQQKIKPRRRQVGAPPRTAGGCDDRASLGEEEETKETGKGSCGGAPPCSPRD